MKGVYEFQEHFYPVKILFAPNKKAWKELMKSMGLDEPYPSTAGRATWIEKNGQMPRLIITLSSECEMRSASEVLGLMCHELIHVIQYVQEVIGKRLDSESESYLMQALVMWMNHSYSDAGRKFKDAP